MLDKLLELWETKEPERCKVGGGIPVVLLCGHWQALNNHRNQFGLSLPILEYALREAIAAKGWHWDLFCTGHQAIIWTQEGDFEFNFDGTEPAIALLNAYLQALGVDVSEVVAA